MKNFAIGTMVLGVLLTASSHVEASHRVLLYQSANDYRDAVREFERQVQRVRYIERCDERLVDDLEDQTSVLRSAARHPEISARFADAWFETLTLQSQVEAAIFGRSCYPRNLILEQSWQTVIYHFSIMAGQVECLHLHPRTTHPVVYPQVYPSAVIPVPTTVDNHRDLYFGSRGLPRVNRLLAPVERSLSTRSLESRALDSRSTMQESFRVAGLPSRAVVAPRSNSIMPISRPTMPSPMQSPSINRSMVSVGAMLQRLSR